MPLRDHFHPPLSDLASWEGLHGGWPMAIVQQLGRVLPGQYVAEPHVHLGSHVEVDVAAFDRAGSGARGRRGDPSQSAPAAWAPVEPTLAVETELGDPDEYEVRVYDAQRGRRLVAVVEIIGPSNKDRPESRGQFVAKCASLLRQPVSIVMVDVVTTRDFNLFAELLERVREEDAIPDSPPSIYAVSSRWGIGKSGRLLETWKRALVVGEVLPKLPLWLNDDLAIPLDLEASYEQTCRDLRMPA